MGMVGLRDVLVVAPAASFHPPLHHEALLPSAEHPIIPILTADNPRAKPPGEIQLWQAQAHAHAHAHAQPLPAQQLHHPQPQAQNPNPNPNSSLSYLKKPMPILNGAGIFSGGGTATCQDCGNQAKKDCTHRRCRTCCKSRGFDCSTHVKSTWVPAARRRERQHHLSAAAGSSASTSITKKPRLISSQTTASHTSTSNTTPPRSFDTSSSQQDASLPGHVRAPAVFKCVRVTSMEDGEDEYAYQAMVKIGGHVFKGFLYDQGVDEGRGGDDYTHITTTSDSNNNDAFLNISELHLGGAATSAVAGRSGAPSSSGMLMGAGPSDVYGGGSGGLLGGTNYGNPIN